MLESLLESDKDDLVFICQPTKAASLSKNNPPFTAKSRDYILQDQSEEQIETLRDILDVLRELERQDINFETLITTYYEGPTLQNHQLYYNETTESLQGIYDGFVWSDLDIQKYIEDNHLRPDTGVQTIYKHPYAPTAPNGVYFLGEYRNLPVQVIYDRNASMLTFKSQTESYVHFAQVDGTDFKVSLYGEDMSIEQAIICHFKNMPHLPTESERLNRSLDEGTYIVFFGGDPEDPQELQTLYTETLTHSDQVSRYMDIFNANYFEIRDQNHRTLYGSEIGKE